MYKEEDFLPLSGIQHFAFCRRQWALAYIELQWQENVRTVEGKLMHLKAHDASAVEKRGDCMISRAMPVRSRELGISGECDIVEFHRGDEGISLTGRSGLYQVVPVEYKRGRPKVTDVDTLQLTAQALCLEERCFAVRFPGDIFIMVRQGTEQRWRSVKNCVIKQRQCFWKCMSITAAAIHPV